MLVLYNRQSLIFYLEAKPGKFHSLRHRSIMAKLGGIIVGVQLQKTLNRPTSAELLMIFTFTFQGQTLTILLFL